MPGHDDQQHAKRHDDDVAVLQEQVGMFAAEQRAVRQHLEQATMATSASSIPYLAQVLLRK